MQSLQDLLVNELQDLYNAENQLIKALPKMAKAASSPKLRAAFEQHLEVTKGQVARLDTIFEQMGASSKGKKCKAMEGLIAEGQELMEEEASAEVRDAALIAAAQKVEHYEIAGYGTVRTFAAMLGLNDAASLLDETLQEEGDADKMLSQLAETEINAQAGQSSSSTDEDEDEDEDEDQEDEDQTESEPSESARTKPAKSVGRKPAPKRKTSSASKR